MVVQRSETTPHRGRWLAAETQFERRGARLWQARMRTGVMHQIRVHAAFIGLVLEGDRLYGGGPDGFKLHHVGLRGGEWATTAVAEPHWLIDSGR
jgi:23S rRNA-/tRNA-specific pseudouridylate synthase